MFARRTEGINASFIRDILKLTKEKNIISFAGGLPNAELFPSARFDEAAHAILSSENTARQALQYGESAGYKPLREIIAKSYKEKDNLDIDPNLIIITNGSQQALDLLGKIFLDKNDNVLIESPTYLAALQAFSFYEPNYLELELQNDGPQIDKLNEILNSTENIKLFYAVVNFQNPSGITWTNEKRQKVADILQRTNKNIYFIEDDPYGEIRFEGKRQKPMRYFYKNTILLGSFSKILAPGLRLGWVIAPDEEVFQKILLAKQAADLHTSEFTQMIAAEFYKNFNAQEHINKISSVYKKQKECMIESLKKYFKEQIRFTNPEGGMFLWVEFDEDINSLDLLKLSIQNGVAFVPGEPFYAVNKKTNTARLNYTNACCDVIEEGVKRLKRAFDSYIKTL